MRKLLNITLLFSTIIHYNNTYCMESLPKDELQQTQAFNNIINNSNILNESKLRQEPTSNIHDQDIIKNMPDGKEQQIPDSNMYKIMNLKKKRANSTGKYSTSIDAINNIKKSNNNNIINLEKKRSKSDGKYSASINTINDKISPAKIKELEYKLHTINKSQNDIKCIDKPINTINEINENTNIITREYTGNEQQKAYRYELQRIMSVCSKVRALLEKYYAQLTKLNDQWHEALNNGTAFAQYSMQDIKVIVDKKPIKLIQYFDDVPTKLKDIAIRNCMAMGDFRDNATSHQKKSATTALCTLAESIHSVLQQLLENYKSNISFLEVIQRTNEQLCNLIEEYNKTQNISHLYHACKNSIDYLRRQCSIVNNELLLYYIPIAHSLFTLNKNYVESLNANLQDLENSISKKLSDKSKPILARDMDSGFGALRGNITFLDRLRQLRINTDNANLYLQAEELVQNMENDLLQIHNQYNMTKIRNQFIELYVTLKKFQKSYSPLNNQLKEKKQTSFKVPSVKINNKEIQLDEYCNNIKKQLQDIASNNKSLFNDSVMVKGLFKKSKNQDSTNQVAEHNQKIQVGNNYCKILESMLETLAQSLKINEKYLQDKKYVKEIKAAQKYLTEKKYVKYLAAVTRGHLLDNKYYVLHQPICVLCTGLYYEIEQYRKDPSNYNLHTRIMQVLDKFIKQCDILNNNLLISTYNMNLNMNDCVDSINSEDSKHYIERCIYAWGKDIDSLLKGEENNSIKHYCIDDLKEVCNKHFRRIKEFLSHLYVNTEDKNLCQDVINLVQVTIENLPKPLIYLK